MVSNATSGLYTNEKRTVSVLQKPDSSTCYERHKVQN